MGVSRSERPGDDQGRKGRREPRRQFATGVLAGRRRVVARRPAALAGTSAADARVRGPLRGRAFAGCEQVLGGPRCDVVVELAREHGTLRHGFTSVWYSPQRLATIAGAVRPRAG